MKNILFVILVLSQFGLAGQSMTWIPAKHVYNKGCSDLTSCEDQIVCYKLQYTPAATGVLTSYTTGFIADCEDGQTKVVNNASCVIDDKSEQTVACQEYGKILLNCSGNSGKLMVEKGVPVILHQICLNATKKNISISESDITKLTTSIDLKGGKACTEFASYEKYMVLNSSEFCQNTAVNMELSAQLKGNGDVRLFWEPARETNDGIYTLQRSFEDGSFEDIYSIGSKIISAEAEDKYEFLDEGISFGAYRYRVTYQGNNGEVLSNVADIFYKNKNESIVIYPNPSVDYVNVFVTAPANEVNLIITDMSGQLVSRFTISTDLEHTLNLEDLPAGLYNVSLKSGDNILSKKLILID